MPSPSRKKLLIDILLVALPMIASQASDTAMLFTDRVFMAMISPEHLSACLSGGISAFVVTTFPMGIALQSTALIAQYFGAKEKKQCGRVTKQCFYLILLIYPIVLTVALLVGGKFFASMGHSPKHTALETEYFNILCIAMIFPLIRTVFSSFFTGLGQTRYVMYGNLLAVLINVPLSYALSLGKWGFESHGIAGVAYATAISGFISCLYFAYMFFHQRYQEDFDTRRDFAFSWGDCKRLLKFGSPAGVELFLQVAAFDLFVLLFQSQGPVEAHAVTLTFNWELLAFLPMIGVGGATMSLVGQALGAKDVERAERVSHYSFAVACAYALIFFYFFLGQTGVLIDAFLDGSEQAGSRDLAITLLRLSTIYLLADAMLIVYSGALKGAGDTFWSMIITISVYWVMAGGTWLLIRFTAASPVIVWSYFVGSIVVLGLIFVIRFRLGSWKKLKMIE